MKYRKVIVYKWQKSKNTKKSESIPIKISYEKVKIGEGRFHQFGVCYEEVEAGCGGYSTAIVEMPNGEIINILLDLIKFIKPLEEVLTPEDCIKPLEEELHE